MSCIPLLAAWFAPAAVAAPLALPTEVIHQEDDAAIYHVDLVVTPDGTVHVLAAENVSDELRYLSDATGSWPATPEVVSPTSDVGPFNLMMTLDPDGLVHAVFDPSAGDGFGHAARAGDGTWSVDVLSTGTRWMRIGFDDEGVLHGAFSTGGLVYGSDASGSWVTEPVRDLGVFEERDPVLVVEDGDVPAVAFVDYHDFSNPSVQLARKVDDAWTFETVDADGGGPLGVVRADDGSLDAVFVRDDGSGGLAWVHATDASGTWVSTPVADLLNRGVADGSALDLARIGDALVWADTTDGLRLFYGTPGTFRTFETDVAAEYVRLEVDGERLLVLANTLDEVALAELPLTDDDDDGVPAAFDTCPDLADPDQPDADADGVGDACDCGDDGACTGYGDDGGWCDGSTPERTDPDCDLCALGPDADGDGVSDACDDCPDDPDKTEPGECGCGEAEVEGCADAPAPGTCGCAHGLRPELAGLGLLLVALGRRRRR